MYDERSSQSVRILPVSMRVVPVGSRLSDLGAVSEKGAIIALCTTYWEVVCE